MVLSFGLVILMATRTQTVNILRKKLQRVENVDERVYFKTFIKSSMPLFI